MITFPAIDPATLPDWMKQARRGFDWGMVVALICSAAIVWPLLSQAQLPRALGYEALGYRSADVMTALQEGRIYPRWSPHAELGYGAPLPHYLPPATPYLSALLTLFFTDDISLSLRLLTLMAYLLLGGAMYAGIAYRRTSAQALLAVLLMLYTPILGQDIPYILGDLPVVLGLALLAAYIWALDKWHGNHHPWQAVLLILIGAAMLLTEPRFAAAAVLALFWHGKRQTLPQRSLLAAASLGLAAFYWLPALTEQALVQWYSPPWGQPNALAWPQLLGPAQQLDSAWLNPSLSYGLGWALYLALGLMVAWQLRAPHHNLRWEWQSLLAGLATLLFALLYDDKDWLWVALAQFALAQAASRALEWRSLLPQRWQASAFVMACLSVLALGAPLLLSPHRTEASPTFSPLSQVQSEQRDERSPLLLPGEALPSTLVLRNQANEALLTGYQQDRSNRFSTDPLIANRASVLREESHLMQFQIRLPEPQPSITLLHSYFDGWQATLDGRGLPLRAASQSGLMQLALPAIRTGELQISFEATPIRSLAWLIAALTVALLLLSASLGPPPQASYRELALLNRAEARLLVLSLLFALGLIFFANRVFAVNLQRPPGIDLSPAERLNVATDIGLNLLGYQLEQSQAQLRLTTYWQGLRSFNSNLLIEYQLQSTTADGTSISSTSRILGNYAAPRWRRDAYISDTISFTGAAIPAGRYLITLSVARCEASCQTSLTTQFFNAQGQTIGTRYSIAQVIEWP